MSLRRLVGSLAKVGMVKRSDPVVGPFNPLTASGRSVNSLTISSYQVLGDHPDRSLLVMTAQEEGGTPADASMRFTSVAFGAAALTERLFLTIDTGGTRGSLSLWELVGPAASTANIVASGLPISGKDVMIAAFYFGKTSGAAGLDTREDGAGVVPFSLALTDVPANALPFDVVMTGTDSVALSTTQAGQTEVFTNIDFGPGNPSARGGASYFAPASSVLTRTFGWDQVGANQNRNGQIAGWMAPA